jgi:hypothetical protein
MRGSEYGYPVVEIEHFLDVELVGTRIAEEQTGGHGDEVADKVHTLVTPLKSEPRNGGTFHMYSSNPIPLMLFGTGVQRVRSILDCL